MIKKVRGIISECRIKEIKKGEVGSVIGTHAVPKCVAYIFKNNRRILP